MARPAPLGARLNAGVGPTRRTSPVHPSRGVHILVSPSKGRLIIVCGLPGSGKTAVARSLEDTLGAVRMSPDDWMDALGINLHEEDARSRIEALQWALARRLLKLELSVIIEWGTWAKSERDALRIGARELGAAVELRYVSAPPDVLVERIRGRARESPPIPEDTILE